LLAECSLSEHVGVLCDLANYIPVRPDLSDVSEKLEWARNNDHIVRQITKNANMFAQAAFSKQAIQSYISDMIMDYTSVYSNGVGLDN
jgi:hypothetical protein